MTPAGELLTIKRTRAAIAAPHTQLVGIQVALTAAGAALLATAVIAAAFVPDLKSRVKP